jgi:hypothetical protein
MEQVFEWLGIVLRVVAASMFALTPGMLVWLAVLGVFLAIRRVGHSGPYQRLRHGDQIA